MDENGERLDHKLVPNRSVCEQNPKYLWKNSNVNFDNSLNGFLPLFQVATFEGWMEVMRDAIDATKVRFYIFYFSRIMFSYIYIMYRI